MLITFWQYIVRARVIREGRFQLWILLRRCTLETRVINMHAVKPIDKTATLAAVKDIGVIVTAEKHQTGGFGSIVASVVGQEKGVNDPLKVDMVRVNDRFGQSALPLQLVQEFGLTAEHIAHGALALMGQHCSEKLPSASACSRQNEFE